jgi:hypothetical protein
MNSIAQQLVEIYHKESWHKNRMTDKEALEYHEKQYKDGNIVVYLEKGEVLGYYQRYFLGNTCFFMNFFIREGFRQSRVTRWLRKHFFSTLPQCIEYLIGEKQKFGGKLRIAKVRR